jgi:subtilisin
VSDASALPAWSTPAPADSERLRSALAAGVTRAWAFAGASGAGVRVAIVDSGIAPHPLVGTVDGAVAVAIDEDDDEIRIEPDGGEDVCGHGTACAGIIRALAPACELHAVRVLGANARGSGRRLIAGLEWAVDERFDVINLSLSTAKAAHVGDLHALADRAYFQGTMIVASAHNMPVESFPWRFASVVSVGSHDAPDPYAFFYNPHPPVEFYARGVDVDVAWSGGGTMRSSGNSFATPHISGLIALIRSKHPGLTPFQIKSVLYQTASNVDVADA